MTLLQGSIVSLQHRFCDDFNIFKKDGDFAAFEKILSQGTERFGMRICGYCIMSNHWHLLLWPREDGVLSDFMRWTTLTHTQRYHAAHGTVGIGHLYQGRFKSFPVEDETYYLTVLRYIEANPLRAEIVTGLENWPWSSYAIRKGFESQFSLSEGPVKLPANWDRLVQNALPLQTLAKLDNSNKRGGPLGESKWTLETASKMGLESTLRPRGRPRKST